MGTNPVRRLTMILREVVSSAEDFWRRRSVSHEGRADKEAGAGVSRLLRGSGGGGAGDRLRRGGGGVPHQGGVRKASGRRGSADPSGPATGHAGTLLRACAGTPLRRDALRSAFDLRG